MTKEDLNSIFEDVSLWDKFAIYSILAGIGYTLPYQQEELDDQKHIRDNTVDYNDEFHSHVDSVLNNKDKILEFFRQAGSSDPKEEYKKLISRFSKADL